VTWLDIGALRTAKSLSSQLAELSSQSDHFFGRQQSELARLLAFFFGSGDMLCKFDRNTKNMITDLLDQLMKELEIARSPLLP
jgi:hypothetical protein